MQTALNFTNKHVVVIGGTSGINRGIAECFARLHANITVASRQQQKVDDTQSALQALGAKTYGFCADVRDIEAIAQGLRTAHDRFGSIDVLVSGAAGNFPALAENMSANGFKSVVDIDLLGTFHVMKASFELLTKPGASIINISAPQAYLPMPAQLHVCAAKAGVDMITRTLALEWGEYGVRINSIVPGPIDGTEGMERLAPTAAIKQKTCDDVPLKRLGTVEDIGHACCFLASPMASYITGAVIPVDGGWSQKGCGSMGDALSQLSRR
ncbi:MULTISPECIES: SDR family oxidoreductase [Corallincola]|uniref:SDR family oxidoreductase n=2 Tax=Corallincola TaxID=1775176 RepID=A0ABY1WNC1_9GAMM|nr:MULTISPECIES: SDR family oxidoreductase [Corallincola]TAA45049.1 SDR family oxidoreductase [Corallincola spongiicola]TCI03671.1 SDR family oxidoreductase [Corallincola luteus]